MDPRGKSSTRMPEAIHATELLLGDDFAGGKIVKVARAVRIVVVGFARVRVVVQHPVQAEVV